MSVENSEINEDFETGFVSESQIEPIDQNVLKDLLICPLFPHILNDPVKCPVCETHFCFKCLDRSLKMNGKCPLCRSEIVLERGKIEPVKVLLFLLENVKTSCENAGKGCVEKFFYKNKSEYTEHIEEKCLFRQVVCPNFKCGKELLKKDLETHIQECKKEKMQCEYCEEEVERGEMQTHIEEYVCSNICKWCNRRYLKRDENHPEECDFLWVVCLKCQGILYKRDFQHHKRECLASSLMYSQMGTPLEMSFNYRRGGIKDDQQNLIPQQFYGVNIGNNNYNRGGVGSILRRSSNYNQQNSASSNQPNLNTKVVYYQRA